MLRWFADLYRKLFKIKFKHPELKRGEIFLTNASFKDYHLIGWKTKRAGTFAYQTDGKMIKDSHLFPVFVQEKEVIKAGMDP